MTTIDQEIKTFDNTLQAAKDQFKIGDVVKINNIHHIGIVVSYNDVMGGIYSGVRYPFFVRIIKTYQILRNTIGEIFPYEVTSLEVIKPQFYKIDCGTKALNNGSHAPLSTMYELAKTTNTLIIPGVHYGDDYILVPDDVEEAKAVEELLNESKLIGTKVDKPSEYALIQLCK